MDIIITFHFTLFGIGSRRLMFVSDFFIFFFCQGKQGQGGGGRGSRVKTVQNFKMKLIRFNIYEV